MQPRKEKETEKGPVRTGMPITFKESSQVTFY
jgi:hypothetical protein